MNDVLILLPYFYSGVLFPLA